MDNLTRRIFEKERHRQRVLRAVYSAVDGSTHLSARADYAQISLDSGLSDADWHDAFSYLVEEELVSYSKVFSGTELEPKITLTG
jgi:hypothetical protein